MITNNITTLQALALAVAIAAAPAAFAQDEQPDSVAKVQLAYRQVNAEDLLGGAETINIADLMRKNYLNDLNSTTLNGYIPGYNGNSLWGCDGDNGGILVLIDGVARDLNNIPPQEVESITFMKGAQAVVLYGSRAAKGAIYITTKRGKEGNLRINAHANTGWAVAKRYPKYLGAAQYMTLYNEARANDGLTPSFTPEQIYNTAAGTNPFRYPDIDMYSDEYVKKVYNRTDADLEISGGNQRARFYTNINYFRQSDYLKFGEAKHNYSDRFSARGNVDVNISQMVSAYVDAAATFYGSRGAHGNYWSEASTLRPNRINPLIPVSMLGSESALNTIASSTNIYDGYFLAGTIEHPTNIFADYLAKGYNKYTSRQFQFDAGVKIDFEPVVKGLTFNTMFAIDYATSYNTGYYNNYATFTPEWNNFNGQEIITDLSQEGKDEHSGVQNISDSSSRQTIHFNAQFDYTRQWDKVHNFHAMALVAGWQRTFSGEYHRTTNVNLGFEADYNYDHRYYLDLSLAGIHSAKLAPGHRQGWSPSATIGWRISQEDWFKGSDVVNELLISASASKIKSDMDITGYYWYSPNYTTGGWFSWAPGGNSAAYPLRGANEDLTFITRTEFSANIRGEFFNRALSLDASFFTHKTDGLPINNSTKYPAFFSTYYPAASFVPWLNYNANRRTGFDFGVKGRKTFGEVELELGVNGTWYKTKATKRDEIWEESYQYREGKPLDAIWGYKCLGYFATDEEAAKADQSALGQADLRAGDLKYADINNDGVIDSKDQVYLGKGGWYGDPFTMGVNLTAKWRGFTLFAHFTGGFGAKGIKDNAYYRITGERKYSVEALGRWTPETAATATHPRLSTGNSNNNFQTSDYWMYDRDRFELARLQLTYDFNQNLFRDKVVKGISLYVSGDNLVMWGKNREIMETNIGSAPQSRFYTLGATVTF